MIDPDTPDSVQGDTPSGQDPDTVRYGDAAPTAGEDGPDTGPTAAPDPQQMKNDGDESAAAKDPDAWVTGDEPMTGPQASYLETLAQQAGVTPPGGLSKAEASRAIEDLRERAGR